MLDDITKRMVEYYFKRGINHPKFRDACIKGILEEMLRSSNVRFEVEDIDRLLNELKVVK